MAHNAEQKVAHLMLLGLLAELRQEDPDRANKVETARAQARALIQSDELAAVGVTLALLDHEKDTP